MIGQKQFSGLIAAFFLSLPVYSNSQAALPETPGEIGDIVGNPVKLEVSPKQVNLVGPRAMQQLLVTAYYSDGTVRDLTALADYSVENEPIISITSGFVFPRKSGKTKLTISAGGKAATIPVEVRNLKSKIPVSFKHDLIAALNVGGCNSGACHGTPSGKNGFKLSLRGYDPPSDYIQLTRDVLGRRTSRLGSERSLILMKALAKVPHEGGKRFGKDSVPARVIRDWLSEGLRSDSKNLPPLSKVEVFPGDRVLNQPAKWQQLSVVAHFADGSNRDVTRLTVFSSSDSAIAEVDAKGLVEFFESGEVAVLCRYLDEMITVRLTYLEPREGFKWNNPVANNYVDRHAFAKLKMLNILPSDLCSDEEFIRRAFLDVCGILPPAEEVKAFLKSKNPKRRAELIDSLLERTEYSDFWTLKWADVLRSTRKTIKVKGTQVFRKWIYNHLNKNTPIDEMVTELLTSSGSTFRNPPANYYRIAKDPTELAETTAQLFFGIRMQCAKCHNHPFERWTQDDYYSLAAFFARVKRRRDPIEPGADKRKPEAQYIYLARSGEVTQPRTQKAIQPSFLGGIPAKIPPGADRRVFLAKWITSPDNDFFAKSIVNRVWYHLIGRGIVDPVDDFRDSNPSANDALLNALAEDFVKHNFDVKHLIRTIMNSRTYQLSAKANEFNNEDEKYFSHAVTKLYTAEQLFDAICHVTGVPENFPGMPPGTRAVQLPDGENNHPFLKAFGQPARELACECERESDSNLGQALQLINGPTVNDRIRNPKNRLSGLLSKQLSDRQILEELYYTALARPPVEGEYQTILQHISQAKNRRKAWEDVLWALINSKEFLFRH